MLRVRSVPRAACTAYSVLRRQRASRAACSARGVLRAASSAGSVLREQRGPLAKRSANNGRRQKRAPRTTGVARSVLREQRASLERAPRALRRARSMPQGHPAPRPPCPASNMFRRRGAPRAAGFAIRARAPRAACSASGGLASHKPLFREQRAPRAACPARSAPRRQRASQAARESSESSELRALSGTVTALRIRYAPRA